MDRIEQWNRNTSKSYIYEIFPKRIQKILLSIPEEEFLKNYNELVSSKISSSFYIHGNVGTGKTILASMILINKLKYYYLIGMYATHKFITIPELFLEIRELYDHKKISEREFLKKFCDYDILVIDDLGIEKTTEWAFTTLYNIINYRYENEKETIITSNLDLDQLAEKLNDDRISSRLHSMCTILQTEGKDKRIQQ